MSRLEPAPRPSRVLKFGVFEVDLEAGELRKSGMRQKLAGQPFRVLQLLLERSQEIVTREELRERIWLQDTFVDYDLALKKAVNRLREVLGDSAESPRFIETIPRRGYRFIAPLGGKGDVSTVAGSSPAKRPWWSRPSLQTGIVLGLGLPALLLALLGLMRGRFSWRWSAATAAPEIHSLAVLPLENLSGDPAQEYFSDGMTDALITDLAQIGSIRVISRTSSMQYKQTKKSLPEIARELGVEGIIEGAVQRSGDRVRISAQLIYGPTDKHLWANSYERDLRDAFALERDLARDIVGRVQVRIGTQNQALVHRSGPANSKALDAYLRGNYYLSRSDQSGSDDAKRTAAQHFQEALDADSEFAPAYIGLANAHSELMRGSSDDIAIAKRAAERALALDPNSAEAWDILGNIKWHAFDWAGAEQDFRRAVALNPNHSSYICGLGALLAATGRLDEALREGELSQGLDPNEDRVSPILEMRGEHSRAIELLQRMVQLHPDDAGLHYSLFRNYAESGKLREASQELEETFTLMGFPKIATDMHRALALSGFRGAMREEAKALENLFAANKAFLPENLAYAHLASGDKDRAFYWLQQAYVHRENVSSDWGLMIIKEDHLLDPLRTDPRFVDLVRRVGLPP